MAKLVVREKDGEFIVSGDRTAVRQFEDAARIGTYTKDGLVINYKAMAKLRGVPPSRMRSTVLRYIKENIRAVKAHYSWHGKQLKVRIIVRQKRRRRKSQR